MGKRRQLLAEGLSCSMCIHYTIKLLSLDSKSILGSVVPWLALQTIFWHLWYSGTTNRYCKEMRSWGRKVLAPSPSLLPFVSTSSPLQISCTCQQPSCNFYLFFYTPRISLVQSQQNSSQAQATATLLLQSSGCQLPGDLRSTSLDSDSSHLLLCFSTYNG